MYIIYSNPIPDIFDGPQNRQILWPTLTNEQLSYLHLTPHPEVQLNYRQKQYAFWTEYINYLIYGDMFSNLTTSYNVLCL